jgi:uncharacterized membrane protein YhaH (DUF805 family)
MSWYLTALRKYADFTGRARRREFWWFYLVNFVIELVLSFLFRRGGFTIIPSLYGLALIIPSWAVACRRLHDIGKSGWWQLIWIIPIVGWIILIVWFASDGHPQANKYGPNPKTPGGTQFTTSPYGT